MKYWTFEQFKQTREKINKVSAWWGKKPKDNRPVISQYIDSLINSLANEKTTYQIGNLDFANL